MIEKIHRVPAHDSLNNAAGNFNLRARGNWTPRGFDAVANIVMHGTLYVTTPLGGADRRQNNAGNVGRSP